MKYRKRKDEDLHIRISKEDKYLLEVVSARCGKTVSRYLELLIDLAIRSEKVKIKDGVVTYEDTQTVFDNQLQYKRIFRK